jgi:DGQHR domain-containing protein
MAVKKKKKKAAAPKLSAEARLLRKTQRAHKKNVRSLFKNIGFDRIPELSDREVKFDGKMGDFDDVFVLENLVVLVEYTAAQTSDVSAHLQKKKIIFQKVVSDPMGFIAYLRATVATFNERLGTHFHADDYHLRIVYCSRFDFDENVKSIVHEARYLDYPALRYFEKVGATIKYSARHEFFDFLGLMPADMAEDGKLPQPNTMEAYRGSILPEKSSGFPKGYKVVSFYADAAALLKRAYVLRRNGWRSTFQAYQRMIQPAKIEAIRRKLKTDKQVFVNNLIATLASDVHPLNEKLHTADISKLTKTEPVTINLPLRANSIGLIDGQHRLFSYYESKEGDDPLIAKLRHQQNLLVTGIIYPDGVSTEDKERFEAALFLSINSNQTNAPAALRQEIEVLLRPSSPTAIGKQVMQRMAKDGPLSGHVESYFFDKGKLKTTSIVSYGLGPLIKLGGEDSLFTLFAHPEKDKIEGAASDAALQAYIQFAASKINMLLNAVKANVGVDRWSPDPKVEGRMLTVTSINSFLITMRYLVKAGEKLEFASLRDHLKNIGKFPFGDYHSSQYGRMAEAIVKKHFPNAA